MGDDEQAGGIVLSQESVDAICNKLAVELRTEPSPQSTPYVIKRSCWGTCTTITGVCCLLTTIVLLLAFIAFIIFVAYKVSPVPESNI